MIAVTAWRLVAMVAAVAALLRRHEDVGTSWVTLLLWSEYAAGQGVRAFHTGRAGANLEQGYVLNRQRTAVSGTQVQ